MGASGVTVKHVVLHLVHSVLRGKMLSLLAILRQHLNSHVNFLGPEAGTFEPWNVCLALAMVFRHTDPKRRLERFFFFLTNTFCDVDVVNCFLSDSCRRCPVGFSFWVSIVVTKNKNNFPQLFPRDAESLRTLNLRFSPAWNPSSEDVCTVILLLALCVFLPFCTR